MSHKLSTVISRQIPEFIREDYPTFVAFVEGYYEYLDQFEKRNLHELRDLDETDDELLGSFKAELDIFGGNYTSIISAGEMKPGVLYKISEISNTNFRNYGASVNTVGHRFVATGPGAGSGTVIASNIDYRFVLRKVKDIFLAKGTEKSYKLLFKLLYNKNAEIMYPWDSVLKASDGKWAQENSIFVKLNCGDATKLPGNTISFVSGDKTINTFVTKVKPYDDGTGILTPAGAFEIGSTYIISTLGTTDFVALGAERNTVGSRFTAISPGVGTGTAIKDMTYELFIDKNYYGVIETTDSMRFNTTVAGKLQVGKTYNILVPGNTDFTRVGAINNAIGTSFIATGVGSGTGITAEISGEILPTVESFEVVQPGENYNIGQIFDAATISGGREIVQKLKVTKLTDRLPEPVADGYLTIGKRYQIVSIGTSNFTISGAITNTVGEIFIATSRGNITGTGMVKTVTIATGGIEKVSVVKYGAGYTSDFYVLQSNADIGINANFTIDKDGTRQYSIPVDSKIEKYIDYGYAINPEYFDTSFDSSPVTAGSFLYSTTEDPTNYIYQIKFLGTTDWKAIGAGGVAVGTIANNTLTVTAIVSGNVRMDCELVGSGIISGTRIISNISGTGGTGTYKLSIPEASIEIDATDAAVVDTSTSIITNVGHGWNTGDAVIYDNNNGTNIGGIVNGSVYYVIKVNDDEFKLAATKAYATAGTYVELTSLPTDPLLDTAHTFTYDSTKFTLTSTTFNVNATVGTIFVCTGPGSGTGIAYRPKYTDDTYGGTLLRQFYQETALDTGVDPKYLLIRFQVGAVAKYRGQYTTNDGFLDDFIRLQDSDKWQKYSYQVTVDEKFSKYRSILNSYLHPAGVKVFGNYEIQNVYNVALGSDQIVGTGNITTTTASTFVTGVGTSFTTLIPKSSLYVYDGTNDLFLGRIKSIISDTVLELDTYAKENWSGNYMVSSKSRIANAKWLSAGTVNVVNKEIPDDTFNVTDLGGIIRYKPYDSEQYFKVLPPFQINGVSDINITSDTIYIYRHGLETGDGLDYYTAGSTIGGLTNDTTYYAIKVDQNRIRIAESYNNAIAGTYINLTSTATGTHRLSILLYNPATEGNFDPDLATVIPFYRTGGNVFLQPVAVTESLSVELDSAAPYDALMRFNASLIDSANDTITIPGHGLTSGTPVVYAADTTPVGGLTNGTTYYVIRVSSSLIKLAATPANAVAATPIAVNITVGTGVDHKFKYNYV